MGDTAIMCSGPYFGEGQLRESSSLSPPPLPPYMNFENRRCRDRRNKVALRLVQ